MPAWEAGGAMRYIQRERRRVNDKYRFGFPNRNNQLKQFH